MRCNAIPRRAAGPGPVVDTLIESGGLAPEKVEATVCFDGGWMGEGEISYAGTE